MTTVDSQWDGDVRTTTTWLDTTSTYRPELLTRAETGHRVRVAVEGPMWSAPGTHAANARKVRGWVSSQVFGTRDSWSIAEDVARHSGGLSVGGVIATAGDGHEKRYVRLAFDGALRKPFDPQELRGVVIDAASADRSDPDESFDFTFLPTSEDVGVSDLEAGGRVVRDIRQTFDGRSNVDIAADSARQGFGAVADAIGKTVKGAAEGVVGGIFGGLGWIGWLVLALALVAVAVAVWLLVKHPAAVAGAVA